MADMHFKDGLDDVNHAAMRHLKEGHYVIIFMIQLGDVPTDAGNHSQPFLLVHKNEM